MLYTPSSYWTNKKVNVGYYAPVGRMTLNLSMFLCALLYPLTILISTLGTTHISTPNL
jgi:hypothetical protein